MKSPLFRFCIPFCCTQSFLLFVALHSHALTVEKIAFADAVTIGEKTVPLRNAALVRYLKLIRAYVAVHNLPEGIRGADVLSDVPKRLELSYLVPIEEADFAAASFGIWLGRTAIDETLKPDLLKGG